MPATGAKPAGASDENSAAQSVRHMFNSIAPRYDLLNHVLSANVDRLWWRRTARYFRAILANPDSSILDICCGTGDMTVALLKHRPRGARPILAADFARAMLKRGTQKFAARTSDAPNALAIEADALNLPLRSTSVDLIVTAFGFRNLANYDNGLRAFHRVLRPGGRLGILDFSLPGGLFGKAYGAYFHRILPAIGRIICAPSEAETNGPYSYLPASVGSFPPPAEMLSLMSGAGFANCAWQPYTFGIAGLYTATRPDVA